MEELVPDWGWQREKGGCTFVRPRFWEGPSKVNAGSVTVSTSGPLHGPPSHPRLRCRRYWCQYNNLLLVFAPRTTAKKLKGKGFPYSLPIVGPKVDPDVQAVSPQVTISHPPGGRLPLLSTRPAVTFPAAEQLTAPWSIPNYTTCLLTRWFLVRSCVFWRVVSWVRWAGFQSKTSWELS